MKARISRLESENSRLRIRLTRLENQLKKVRPSNSLNLRQETTLSPTPSTSSIEEPMFDRLAILVIEMKERIQDLEIHVNALEK